MKGMRFIAKALLYSLTEIGVLSSSVLFKSNSIYYFTIVNICFPCFKSVGDLQGIFIC